MMIGAAAAAMLYRLGHRNIAYVAGGVTLVVGGLSLVSPAARDAITKGLAWFGRMVGSVTGSVLLTLVYIFALTPARFIKRFSGDDDLRLRDTRPPTYFEPCDAPERKVRHARTMFATEVPKPRRGGVLVWVVTAFLLLGMAELILRYEGFGPGAVLYVSDGRAGYYPAPNQRLERYGGSVYTNEWGMRAPHYTEQKPPGKFRILMLGDSTLWGGSYVDQDGLYARILDRKLDELAGGDLVEVFNMGVNGWGPFHERGWIDRFGALDSDLIFICLPTDDVDRERYSLMTLPFFTAERPPVLGLEEVAGHSMWRFRRSRVNYGDQWRAEQSKRGIREYERLGVYLRDGDPGACAIPLDPPPRTKVGGAEVFFEILPSQPVGFGQPPPDGVEGEVVKKLQARLGALGFPVAYPAGHFAGKGAPDEIYHDEGHLHVKGHRVYADYLFERVTGSSKRFAQWLAQRSTGKAP